MRTLTAHECASCKQVLPVACCWCDAELCEGCMPRHLALCEYQKCRTYRTWKWGRQEKKGRKL